MVSTLSGLLIVHTHLRGRDSQYRPARIRAKVSDVGSWAIGPRVRDILRGMDSLRRLLGMHGKLPQ